MRTRRVVVLLVVVVDLRFADLALPWVSQWLQEELHGKIREGYAVKEP